MKGFKTEGFDDNNDDMLHNSKVWSYSESQDSDEPPMTSVCATQKIALSPFLTQKTKSVFNRKSEISQLVEKDIDSDQFGSQSLLDLCSGAFKETNEEKVEEEEDNDEEVSDDSDHEESDEKKEEEEEEEVDEKTNVNSFFDNEAELSGSEASSDEDEDEDDGHLEEDEEQEDLPSDSDLRKQVAKLHHKQLLDEDKRELMILKEMMFEDGDLHEDGQQREKKFRWKFETDNNFVNDYINEDSSDNYMSSDEDEKIQTPTLKMFDRDVNQNNDHKSLDDLKTKLQNGFQLKDINKRVDTDSRVGIKSLSTFVVRDQRLTNVMSFKSKRSLSDKNKSNKRLKNSKKLSKPSIFDFLYE